MATHHRWALAAVAVAGVSVLSVQQTGALWSDSASLDGTTLTSGSLGIEVGASGATSSDYTFVDLTGPNMMSGDYVQHPLHVLNTGTEAMQYRLESATLDADLPLQLQVTAVSSEAECPASGDAVGDDLYSGSLTDATTSYRALSSGASEILCFRVTMGENPTAGEQGTATFTFQGTQS